MELDFFETINKIFMSDLKSPGFYDLKLNDAPNNKDININDILIHVFLNGLNTLFGNSVTLLNISNEQYNIANNYMKSLGYSTYFNYKYDKDNKPINIDIWFEPNKQN